MEEHVFNIQVIARLVFLQVLAYIRIYILMNHAIPSILSIISWHVIVLLLCLHKQGISLWKSSIMYCLIFIQLHIMIWTKNSNLCVLRYTAVNGIYIKYSVANCKSYLTTNIFSFIYITWLIILPVYPVIFYCLECINNNIWLDLTPKLCIYYIAILLIIVL